VTPKRILLHGPNGSVKTTLLLLIKAKLGDRAFYLPAYHRLKFSTSLESESTGEAAYCIMEELQRSEEASVLLLDEWDANLDAGNRAQIPRMIDEMAMNRAVVEVRYVVRNTVTSHE
jgi:ABC-type cobalamin/Fe3+-siderophores transport system ATPase subunit